MSAVYEKLRTCLESIQKKVDFKPEVALILGSGLGDYADEIDVVQTLIQKSKAFQLRLWQGIRDVLSLDM